LFKDRASPVNERAHLRSKILPIRIHDGNRARDRTYMRQNLDKPTRFELLGNAGTERLDHPEPRERARDKRFGVVHEDR